MRIPFLDRLSPPTQSEVYQFANDVQRAQAPKTPDKGEYTWTQLAQLSAARVRQRIGVYNPERITHQTFETMSRHHQLAFGLAFIRLPLESVEWYIECEDPDIKAFTTQVIGSVWRGLVKSSLLALERGYAPHEIVWQELSDYRVKDSDLDVDTVMPSAFTFDRIKGVDPEYVTLILDGDRLAGFEQTGISTPIEADKCFWFVNDERYGNLYGRARLVHSYDPWYWQAIMVAFNNRYRERFGQPATVCKAPAGETQTGVDNSGQPVMQNNLDLMQEAGEALLEQSTVTIPSAKNGEAEYSIEYLSDDKRGAEFESIFNKYDAWMLRGLFIPERALTQDTEVGSNSMASTHADMYLLGEESILGDILDAINHQLLPPLLRYNFGANVPECSVASGGFSDDRRAMLKEFFTTMIQSGQAQPAAEELARELGVPMAEGAASEDVVDDLPMGEPEDGNPTGDDGEPDKEELRSAAQTLSEAHHEVKRLLSERKLQDVCSC